MSAQVLYCQSPIGELTLAARDGAVTHLLFGHVPFPGAAEGETPLLKEARRQLEEYFARGRREFTLPLHPQGTPFQEKVWQALLTIPYGETRTYQGIALLAGSPKAVRAVGSANHHNPISIFIPCHRVIGKNGSLTGYGGGLPAKRFLLELEKGWEKQA